MSSRSNVSLSLIVKNFLRVAKHPWIGVKLASLEAEKRFFNTLYPQSSGGLANKIRQASFRITDRCNLRCHTCGQWGDQGFLHNKDLSVLKKQEVQVSRYQEVLSDLVAHGHHPLIYFWGGEPMLYEGTLDLIETATRLGLPCSIATNGTRIARAAERLVRAPLFLLQVSIDGHNAALHNAVRPGAAGGNNFADIQAGLQAVRQARRELKQNLPLLASLTVISQQNYRHLQDIYEAFRDQVDLFVFYLSWWIDPPGLESHIQDFQSRFGFPPSRPQGWLSDWRPDDIPALDRQIQDLKARSQAWSAPPVTFIPDISGVDELARYYTDHEARFGYNQCISIFQAVEVNSNGDLSPCRDYHDYVVGNIKDATITQLWNNPAYQKFRRSLATEGLMPVCTRCCGLMGY
jgi:radical SAM protein with 4Fe4S-binding SPASM domain